MANPGDRVQESCWQSDDGAEPGHSAQGFVPCDPRAFPDLTKRRLFPG